MARCDGKAVWIPGAAGGGAAKFRRAFTGKG
jgi:hypothetical protein